MTTLAIPTHAPAVTGPPQGYWTIADWEKLPDDGNRYEIINGVLYMTTAPSFFHQWIVRRLDRFVGVPAETQGLAYAAVAPVGLIMPGCDPVQPDFVIVLKHHAEIIRERRIMGVPNLIVEVMSPGSIAYDLGLKLETYAQAAVPEYAVVNPAEQTLSLYQLDQPEQYAAPQVFRESDPVAFSCLPTIQFAVANLFEDAPDTSL
jgi:Uma2 family endonuclease